MLETIKKESRDIDFKSQREMKINYIRAGIKDKVFFDKLLDLGVKYEKNISNKDID